MFEEYLQDASDFLQMAESASASGNDTKAKRYYRACVFCASSAMEAFVNYIADSFSKAKSLDPYELAYLNDKQLSFAPGKGVSEKTEYHPVDGKLRVLLARFSPTFDFTAPIWDEFMQLKNLRDSLVHPRTPEDHTPMSSYAGQVPRGLRTTIGLMNDLSQAVFQSPLRKQLLDLSPE
jgi:hypothetical protein